MERRTKILTAAVAAGLVVAGGAGAAFAGDDDTYEGPDVPIRPGTDLERASQAALAHTGGGTVTGSEAGDEESYYEIEVTLDDGTQIVVQLDEQFDVVGEETDRYDDDDPYDD